MGEALRRGLRPEQILVWVFTSEAATVFTQRMLALGLDPNRVRRITVRTVDDFARQQWREWEGEQLPYYPSLADLHAPIMQALEACSQRYAQQYPYLEIRSHAAAISQFYQTQLRLKQSLALQQENPDLSHAERADLYGVPLSEYLWTLAYERLRVSAFSEPLFRGRYDASYDLACSLIHQPELAASLPQYRLIVVDELHDMNATAFCILQALLQAPEAYLVAAGDSDQVIYPHMGADKRYLHEHFEQHFPTVSRFQLSRSFRYGPWLALSAGAFKQKDLDSGLAYDSQIAVHTYAEHEQPQALLKALAQFTQQRGRNLDQCAVILRGLHQSVVIENALLEAHVPYRCAGFSPYLQRDEILFVRGLLALALDKLTDLQGATIAGMVRALNQFGEAQLNPDEVASAQADIAQDANILRYFYTVRMLEKSAPTAAHRNRQAIDILTESGPDAPAAEVLPELYACLDIQALAKRIYLDTSQAEIISESLLGLVALAEQQGFNLLQLHQWMAQADAFIDQGVCWSTPDDRPRRRPAHVLSLLCADQAKGTEFAHVLIPFLTKGQFPRAEQPTINEENLFYVACTRAQAQLSLFMPEQVEQQSPFVQRLQIDEQRPAAQTLLQELKQRLARMQGRVSPQAQATTASRQQARGRQDAAQHAQQSRGWQDAAQHAQQARGHRDNRLRSATPQRREQSSWAERADGRRIYLQVPFAEKDEAKALGAYWDPQARLWYIPHWVAPEPLLQRWPRHEFR